MYYQLTLTRARALEPRWKSPLQRYRGAAPVGLGLLHMLAESNGVQDPAIQDIKQRPIGLMQVPYRLGRHYGRTEEKLKDTEINIYTWGIQTNKDADYLHRTYPTDWTAPSIDFWCAVRLFWILKQTTFNNLYNTVRAAGASYRKVTGILSWTRTQMTQTQHFGRYAVRDLRRIADHLEKFKNVLTALEGTNHVTKSWSEQVLLTPGNYLDVLETGAL